MPGESVAGWQLWRTNCRLHLDELIAAILYEVLGVVAATYWLSAGSSVALWQKFFDGALDFFRDSAMSRSGHGALRLVSTVAQCPGEVKEKGHSAARPKNCQASPLQ